MLASRLCSDVALRAALAAFCLLPSANRHLPTAFCPLLPAYCLLPFASRLLPSAYRLLPSDFCLLR